MIFGNPVRGIIHPTSWKRPSGNLDFVMTQDFGPTSLVAEPSYSWSGSEGIAAGYYAHFHKGIDLGNGHCGADVFAAGKGVVVVSQTVSTNGENIIVIDHGGGWRTAYGHLASRIVSEGAKVVRGQRIGTVGDTGNSTACHLHFGVKWDVPPGGNFYSSSVGHLLDPWRRLIQNVTIHPRAAGVNIRDTAGSGSTPGPLFATTGAAGNILRASDSANLGPFSAWRAWGGTVNGASYTVAGVTGSTWEKINLDGAYRYIATPLAAKSAS